MSEVNIINDARCVTFDELYDIAMWCGGDQGMMYEGHGEGQHYIQVGEDRAVVGDWIIRTGETFKRLTDAEYKSSFLAATRDREKFAKVMKIVTAAIHDGSVNVIHGVGVEYSIVAEQAALLIMELFSE